MDFHKQIKRVNGSCFDRKHQNPGKADKGTLSAFDTKNI